jgi:hypothetical protein
MAMYVWRIYDTVLARLYEVVSAAAPTDHGGNAVDGDQTVILYAVPPAWTSAAGVRRIEATFKAAGQPWLPVSQTTFTTMGEVAYPGTDLWTPTLARVIMSRGTPGVDLRGYGNPLALRFMYTGDGCGASSNSQHSSSCSGNPAYASSVRIVCTHCSGSAHTWFDGMVALGATFDATAAFGGKSTISDDFCVHILSVPGNTLLQSVRFSVNSGAPLHEGDQFGSVVAVGVTGTNGSAIDGSKYALRLFDLTNGRVVASVPTGGGLVALSAAEQILRTTSFSNLPAGEAIFEVQARNNGGAVGQLYHVTLEE